MNVDALQEEEEEKDGAEDADDVDDADWGQLDWFCDDGL